MVLFHVTSVHSATSFDSRLYFSLFILDSHGNPLKDPITPVFEVIPFSSVSLPNTYNVTAVAMVVRPEAAFRQPRQVPQGTSCPARQTAAPASFFAVCTASARAEEETIYACPMAATDEK